MGFQLTLFGAAPKEKRACFFSLHPRRKEQKFSAYAPKAMMHFAGKYSIPIAEDVSDLDSFDVVFFSLHCFRDFYLIAKMAHHKRKGQEWIAGGNACATPVPMSIANLPGDRIGACALRSSSFVRMSLPMIVTRPDGKSVCTSCRKYCRTRMALRA